MLAIFRIVVSCLFGAAQKVVLGKFLKSNANRATTAVLLVSCILVFGCRQVSPRSRPELPSPDSYTRSVENSNNVILNQQFGMFQRLIARSDRVIASNPQDNILLTNINKQARQIVLAIRGADSRDFLDQLQCSYRLRFYRGTNFFMESLGIPVAAGLYPPWLTDSDEVISAVVPDEHGVVRSGIY
jgi:hypothetical protein